MLDVLIPLFYVQKKLSASTFIIQHIVTMPKYGCDDLIIRRPSEKRYPVIYFIILLNLVGYSSILADSAKGYISDNIPCNF